MFTVFLIGTAGSGKSLLTSSLANWLKLRKQNVATMNLDPGALFLPYVPDVDVRDYVNLEQIMKEYELGPNGSLIIAADFISEEIGNLRTEIEDFGSDLLIVDTPGQMELFAFRASGPYIVGELTTEPTAIIYLFDSVFSANPLNYVSNLFLSAAVYNRFFVPQVNVLSKSDLLPPEDANRIIDWAAKPRMLEAAIDEKLSGTRRLLSLDMMQAIYRLGLHFLLMPVSARTNRGMTNLNAMLLRCYNRDQWTSL